MTPRTNASARQAGSRFERVQADALAEALDADVDRRVKYGTKDRGDIGGLRSVFGERIVVECKNTTRLALGTWMNEARLEAGNDDAPIALVMHKRKGITDPMRQYVTMEVRDLLRLGWNYRGEEGE